MNAFESGRRKAVPAVLLYPRFGRELLMLHRDAPDRPDDFHAGKWNGLGGKCEPDESPLQTARRELREESGLRPPSAAFRPLGVLQFPDFKPHRREDWIVYVFSVRADASMRRRSLRCPEGSLHWVPSKDVLSLNLWSGDRWFLPLVLRERPFLGTIWYKAGRAARRWIVEL